MSRLSLLSIAVVAALRTGSAWGDGLEERLERLEADNERLRQALVPSKVRVPSLTVMNGVKLRILGYADFGFFIPEGDGVAYVRDVGKAQNPDRRSFPWVFLGDPWANPVNSQGDSANLGLDRSNIARFDPIRSGGKASFLVNLMNLGIVASIGSHLLFETSINFEPRQGHLGAPGDVVDLKLAYLQWRPLTSIDLSFYLGKFDSAFGIEYRRRRAPDRFGITPSIISRYTVGTPTGLKVRGSVFGGHLIYAFSVTNGGTSTERFAHFYNEIDANDFKTLSGRLAFAIRSSRFAFEIGGSALFGTQDLQSDESLHQWQLGADLRLRIDDFELRAEYLEVRADGGGIENAPRLYGRGAYLQLSYQVLAWAGAMLRVDWRDVDLFAFPNLYLTDVGRIAFGLRFDILYNVIAKLEYLMVRELSGVTLSGDLFTASVIFRF